MHGQPHALVEHTVDNILRCPLRGGRYVMSPMLPTEDDVHKHLLSETHLHLLHGDAVVIVMPLFASLDKIPFLLQA